MTSQNSQNIAEYVSGFRHKANFAIFAIFANLLITQNVLLGIPYLQPESLVYVVQSKKTTFHFYPKRNGLLLQSLTQCLSVIILVHYSFLYV